MNLENFFLSTQDGGPSEEKVMEIKDSLIDEGELPEGATLAQLVRYVRKQNKQTTKVPRNREEYEAMRKRRFKKAKGGYVKKYAKGGGVRKVRT